MKTKRFTSQQDPGESKGQIKVMAHVPEASKVEYFNLDRYDLDFPFLDSHTIVK